MTNARKYHFTVLEALSTKLKQLKYVYYIINDDKDYNAYIIPTLELKEMIEQKIYFKTVKGGDRWASKGYLFKLSCLSKYKV